MKIMFINSVVDFGSTGKIVRTLANSLKADGHQVLIAYGRNEVINQDDVFDMTDNLGFYNHILMTRLFDRHGLHSINATNKLVKKIKEFQPDVIHLHNLHGYYLNYPILMKFLKKQKTIKIVWTLHDLWSVSGSVAHYSYFGCKEFNQGCVIANNPRTYPKSSLFLREKKNFYLKKDLFMGFNNLEIITVSDWQKDVIQTTFLNKYPVIRIYNGIDFNKYQKARFIKKVPKTILGSASDWNNQKGILDFIELSKRLPTEYQIILLGLNEKELRAIPENIKGLERISDEEKIIDLYAKSSIYLNLSVEEVMGMTTVEALACGTPTIVYDKTAVPEIIDETVGQVVVANDIDALVLAIEEVTKRNIDPNICYEFAKERYNENQMIKAYKDVYFR